MIKNSRNEVLQATLKTFFKDWLYIQDNIKPKIYKKFLHVNPYCYDKYIKGFCVKCETNYFKKIFCNKEFCKNRQCQESSHLRRWARALPKFSQFNNFGYFVFTFPTWFCQRIGKEFLKRFRSFIWYLLQKYIGKIKSIFRYHFFGDNWYKCEALGDCEFKKQNKNKKLFLCDNFYYKCSFKKDLYNAYFPHLNVLIDYQFINESVLDNIKKDIKKWIFNITGEKLEKIVIHYEYTKDLPRAMHWIKYIFRSTFREIKNLELYAAILYKFRNTVYKGKYEKDKTLFVDIIKNKFGDIPKKVERESVKIINNICLICNNKKLDWESGLIYFLSKSAQEIGESGYYFELKPKNLRTKKNQLETKNNILISNKF